MAINVTLGEVKTQEAKPFPKLMQNQFGEIFYMIRDRYGLPLTDFNDNHWIFEAEDFADFSDSINYVFTDYNEPITIQNA